MSRTRIQGSNSEKSARSGRRGDQFASAQESASGTTLLSARASATMTAPAADPTHEQIAERARAIWKARPADWRGRDEENWLEAERQLLAEMHRR